MSSVSEHPRDRGMVVQPHILQRHWEVRMKIVKTTTIEEAKRQVYAMIDDGDTEFVVGNDFGGFDLVRSIPETEFEEEVNEVIASFHVLS